MSLYNLTDNVNKDFKFQIEGKSYTMRYPLLGEIENMQEITEKQKEAKDKNDKVIFDKLTEEINNFIYSFITPEIDGDEDIYTVLKKQNMRVMQNFTKMIKVELGLE